MFKGAHPAKDWSKRNQREEPARLLSVRIIPGLNESNSESGISPMPLPCCKDDFMRVPDVVFVQQQMLCCGIRSNQVSTNDDIKIVVYGTDKEHAA